MTSMTKSDMTDLTKDFVYLIAWTNMTTDLNQMTRPVDMMTNDQ